MVQSDPDKNRPRLEVLFFRTSRGSEPVREWLRSLSTEEKRIIGEDIKTVQFGFPLGIPLVEKIEPDLWELRSKLPRRIARILFTVEDDLIILLHGFIKKTRKITLEDLRLARRRLNQVKGE